jgi:hypothetical protein
MMAWYIAAGILFLIATAILVVQFVRDRRYLGKKTSQAMGTKLWDEIEEEREASKARHEKFMSAMKKAESKENREE